MTQQKQFFKAAAWLVGAILLTACTHDGDLDGGTIKPTSGCNSIYRLRNSMPTKRP